MVLSGKAESTKAAKVEKDVNNDELLKGQNLQMMPPLSYVLPVPETSTSMKIQDSKQAAHDTVFENASFFEEMSEGFELELSTIKAIQMNTRNRN